MVRRLRLIRAVRIATNADETQERAGTVKIAFATEDLKRVDAHFGWAKNIAVYELSDEECKLVEVFQFEGDLKEDGNENKLDPQGRGGPGLRHPLCRRHRRVGRCPHRRRRASTRSRSTNPKRSPTCSRNCRRC